MKIPPPEQEIKQEDAPCEKTGRIGKGNSFLLIVPDVHHTFPSAISLFAPNGVSSSRKADKGSFCIVHRH
jgi:hypothetical protein